MASVGRWWEKSDAPGEASAQDVDGLAVGIRDGMGVGFVTVVDVGLYPFFLTSAYTARTFITTKEDEQEVEIDILWAFILSVVTGAVISYFLRSKVTMLYAIGLGAALSLIYLIRGGFLRLPFSIPGITPQLARTS